MSAFFITFFLVSLICSVYSDCVPTATQGCLNGNLYDFATQFPCGSMQSSGYQPLYNFATTGCCAQGIPFDKSSQYCCFDGVHDYSSGFCGEWNNTASNPTCYDCTTAKEKQEEKIISTRARKVKSGSSSVPIDTSVKNTGNLCYTATSTLGCLNTYEYDYNTTYPCGNFLLDLLDFGCCLGSAQTWYNYETDTCCYNPDTSTYTVVSGDAHACSCTAYGCNPNV